MTTYFLGDPYFLFVFKSKFLFLYCVGLFYSQTTKKNASPQLREFEILCFSLSVTSSSLTHRHTQLFLFLSFSFFVVVIAGSSFWGLSAGLVYDIRYKAKPFFFFFYTVSILTLYSWVCPEFRSCLQKRDIYIYHSVSLYSMLRHLYKTNKWEFFFSFFYFR